MKLLTGNDLKSGAVLWWMGAGWSIKVGDAVDVGDAGEVLLQREDAARRVNAPYLIDAIATPGGPCPTHIKDRVRAAGPTVRSDLPLIPANAWTQ